MARRIISATDYGFRKVIKVVMNDAIPEWVHPIDGGATHTPVTARGPFIFDETTGIKIPGSLNPSLQAGVECHSCVFNHTIREFIFTGEELLVEDLPGSGTFRHKTNDELVAEIEFRLLARPPAIPIGPLTGQVI